MTGDRDRNEPKSGDLCFSSQRFEYAVYHYRCDDYRDGTITSVLSGKILETPDHYTPIGFER